MLTKTEPQPDNRTLYSVPPVVRAIKVLRHIAAGGSVANQSRAAREIGVNRTTLLRILHTLEAEGLISRVSGSDDYILGAGMVELAGRTLSSLDTTRIAQDVLRPLALEIGLSCHLGILEGREVLYAVRATPDTILMSNIRIGTRLPAHASSMGRAILAWLSPDRVDALYDGQELFAVTAQTATTLGALHRQLQEAREIGYVDARSAYESGIDSIAAPVHDVTGDVVGAINATGPSHAFGDEPRRTAIAAAVVAGAAEISRRLGHAQR